MSGSSCVTSGVERVRTVTTIAGVALGIAVVVAIQLTNASSIRGFETALETVAGRTSVEIVGGGAGLDETRLPELGWLREFGVLSPVIEGDMALVTAGAPRPGTAGRGPKPCASWAWTSCGTCRSATTTSSSSNSPRGRTPARRPATNPSPPRSFSRCSPTAGPIVIGEKLARRQRTAARRRSSGSWPGDRVDTFVVRGLLKDEGPARVLDGNFVLMDIAAAQAAFDRFGRLDRVDVLLGRRMATWPLTCGYRRRGCRPGSRPSGRRGGATRWNGCWRRST